MKFLKFPLKIREFVQSDGVYQFISHRLLESFQRTMPFPHYAKAQEEAVFTLWKQCNFEKTWW